SESDPEPSSQLHSGRRETANQPQPNRRFHPRPDRQSPAWAPISLGDEWGYRRKQFTTPSRKERTMYPHVTQFETRTIQIRDEIPLQAELEALRRPTQTPRRIALPRRILWKLRVAGPMNARIKQLGIALLAAAAFAVPASGASQPGQLAGPSFTPKELEALK